MGPTHSHSSDKNWLLFVSTGHMTIPFTGQVANFSPNERKWLIVGEIEEGRG